MAAVAPPVGVDILAATGNTWGISGPQFLTVYALAGLGAIVLGFVLRARVLSVTDAETHPAVTASETAMLFDDRRPVLAGLAQLRGQQLIDSHGTPRDASAAERHGLDRFTHSLHDKLRSTSNRNVRVLEVSASPALERLREDLTERGYLMGPQQRKALYRCGIAAYLVLGVGALRLVAGFAANRPIGWLIAVTVALCIGTFLVARPVRLTGRGRAAVDESLRRNGHLRPDNNPAYTSYGPESAALAAALFGAAVLWSLDPNLADATGTLAMGATSGAGGSCSSGGGDGGGDGGGCGGGCGGCGGCGG